MRTIHHTRSSDGQLVHILFDRTQHIIDYDIWHDIYKCTFANMSYKNRVKELHVKISMARWLRFTAANASDDDHLPESKVGLKDNRPAWIYIRGCGCRDQGKEVLYRFQATYGMLLCMFANAMTGPPPRSLFYIRPSVVQVDAEISIHNRGFKPLSAHMFDFCHIAATQASVHMVVTDALSRRSRPYSKEVEHRFRICQAATNVNCVHRRQKISDMDTLVDCTDEIAINE